MKTLYKISTRDAIISIASRNEEVILVVQLRSTELTTIIKEPLNLSDFWDLFKYHLASINPEAISDIGLKRRIKEAKLAKLSFRLFAED